MPFSTFKVFTRLARCSMFVFARCFAGRRLAYSKIHYILLHTAAITVRAVPWPTRPSDHQAL